mmetsp:Transcript_14980/g.30341  ORF Transcript_14980/g.30341 Transcript_14980/m.30341 type:complete len:89 (+) Transcript_14980:1854-2120(+)
MIFYKAIALAQEGLETPGANGAMPSTTAFYANEHVMWQTHSTVRLFSVSDDGLRWLGAGRAKFRGRRVLMCTKGAIDEKRRASRDVEA